MPEQRDFDFGNALVAVGLISLDRVRDGLKLVEQAAASGRKATLEQVLIERRWISSSDAAIAYRKMQNSAPAAAAPSTIPDNNIAGFQVLNEIGAGSMGTVFRARQTSADRIVAVKIMSPKFARNRDAVERFVREAKAAARLTHPNLVSAYDVGEHQGRPYLVMEYIEGTTGARLIRQHGTLEVGQVVDVAMQIAAGLDAAHRAGLIHRDIRPEKTLFNAEGVVKLVDLALASEEKSMTGDMALSPRYISPELARGEKRVDIRSDLYMLGCTLYHFATGELPFPADSGEAMAKRHVNDPVPSAKMKRNEIGDRLNAIIYRLMQKRPDARYQTPGELMNDLKLLEARRKPVPVLPKEEPSPARAAPEPVRVAPSKGTADRYVRSGGGGMGLYLLAGVVVAGIGLFVFRDTLFPPKAPVVEPVEPVKPVDDTTAKRAQTELDTIAAFATSDPRFERIEEVLRRFQVAAAAYKGTKFEGMAIERKVEYLKKAEESAKLALDEAEARAVPHRSAGRLRDELREFERYPARFLETTNAGTEVKQIVARLSGSISERFARDKGELERMVQQKQYARALEKLQDMRDYALNAQLGDLDKRELDIRMMKEATTSAVEKSLNDAYLAQLEPAVRKLMLERKYPEAAAAVRDFMMRSWSAEEEPFVKLPAVDYAAIDAGLKAADWPGVLKRSEEGAGDPTSPLTANMGQRLLLDLRNAATLEIFRRQVEAGLELAFKGKDKEKYDLEVYPGEKCFFERRGGKKVLVIDGKRALDFDDPWAELKPLDHAQLSERSVDPDRAAAKTKAGGDPVQLLRWALYLYYLPSGDKYWEVAEEWFKRSIQLKGRGVRIYLANLLVQRKADREHMIKAEFESAKKLVAERRWREAERTLEKIRAEADSPFVNKNLSEIDTLNAKVVEALRAEKEFEQVYRGKVASLDGGRLKVSYDFEAKDQLDAFEILELDPKVKGKWSLDRGAIGSSGDKSAIRWRTPVKGDVEIEYDLTPVDEAQNLAVDLYWNAGANKHYGVVFGFDIITGKEDPKNEVEKAQGMARNCILKYPLGVKANDPDWPLPAFWNNLFKRQVGKAVGEWPLAKNKKAHIKVSRLGNKLSFAIDGGLQWEGEDGDYAEGSLLFYADSRARIDNLVITFKP